MRLSDPYNVTGLRNRTKGIGIFFAVLIGILFCRLWYLQIWKGEVYREFSDKNRFKKQRLSTPRGQILDRYGRLLADSRPRFDVTFTRVNSVDFQEELKKLKIVFRWNEEEFQKRIQKISSSYLYQPQIVARDISYDQLAYVESHSFDFPALDIEVIAVRDYLYQDAFFHVLGYTGEMSETTLKHLQKKYPERKYRLGDQWGVMGVEAIYEDVLRGEDGFDFIVVDVKGRRVQEERFSLFSQGQRIEPKVGKTVRMTLDLDLQLEAVKAFKDQVGGVVALDLRTGEILAYVSRPALDANLFNQVLSNEEFKRLAVSENNPFLDRVVAEHYPPGSTIKLMMAVAALEESILNSRKTFFCPGYFRFGNRIWRCHKKEGHGTLSLVEAIEQSCDVFFYNTALWLGLDKIFSWGKMLGLGERTFLAQEDPTFQVRFNVEQPGFLPSSLWVRKKGHTSVEAETVNIGIGQGGMLVTLMQLARLISFLGNDGKVFYPQLVLSIMDENNHHLQQFQAHLDRQIHLKPKTLNILFRGMENVIYGSHGTARSAQIRDVRWGGKTGTAQVIALPHNRENFYFKHKKEWRDHALFIGLAPIERPTLAVAVIVEHGQHGGSAAAPIAKAIVQTYLQKTNLRQDAYYGPTLN